MGVYFLGNGCGGLLSKLVFLCVAGFLLSGLALAQGPQAAVDGIPVTDALVVAKCSGCHRKDEKGNLTRISWERTTPEGWQEVIKRMVRSNGLQLTPDEARAIVKSLSTSHGLAPEEAKPVMYMAEHTLPDEVYPTPTMRTTCGSCHAFGRPASWRRSLEEWKLLLNMHIGYYPNAEGAAAWRLTSLNAGIQMQVIRRKPLHLLRKGRSLSIKPSTFFPRTMHCTRRNGRRGGPKCGRLNSREHGW